MTALFQYTLAVSIPLFILWTTYRWVLASEKQFAANRFVLLSIYIVSLILFPATTLVQNAASASTGHSDYTIALSGTSAIVRHLTPIAALWLVGACVTLSLTLIDIARIYAVIRRCRRIEFHGLTVYLSPDIRLSPFSLGKTIVMNESDYSECPEAILNHESGHIRYRHSLDMLLAQCVAILCWYNPAAWLMRSELKSVHEYQADSFTLAQGCSVRDYQMFLIRKAVGSKFPAIANNLNHSKLRKRISMMNRTDSPNAWHRMRYILPFVGIALGITILATPMVKAAITPVKNTYTTKKPQQPTTLDGIDIYIDGVETPYNELNQTPTNDIKSITVNKQHNRIDIFTKD